MITYIIIAVIALLVAVAAYSIKNEEQIVEKAQKSKNMFNFYHMLAVMTSPTYKGYVSTKEEEKAMKEFLNGESEYDSHPIGSYLKMRNETSRMLKSMVCPSFNIGEVGVGVAVMLLFASVVVVGVMFS